MKDDHSRLLGTEETTVPGVVDQGCRSSWRSRRSRGPVLSLVAAVEA